MLTLGSIITTTGTISDIVRNPLALTSRMVIGNLFEMVMEKILCSGFAYCLDPHFQQ
jgi:DNA-directed RNA polymerase beta subunit